jgi:plasmid stabilization system protein ParE
MTRTVRLRDEAERDLAEAASWYELQQPGLGREFLDEASRSFQSLADLPTIYPVVKREARRALMKRFPFGIYYQSKTKLSSYWP